MRKEKKCEGWEKKQGNIVLGPPVGLYVCFSVCVCLHVFLKNASEKEKNRIQSYAKTLSRQAEQQNIQTGKTSSL